MTLAKFRWVILAFAFSGASARAFTLAPGSVGPGWRLNDLSAAPLQRLALGGAVVTLTNANATIVVRRSKPLPAAWPDDVDYWTKQLVGDGPVIQSKAARLSKVDGRRTYLVETQSDSNSGTQLHTALLVVEVIRDGVTRLAIFSFEDTPDVYRAGAPAVRAQFRRLRPLEI